MSRGARIAALNDAFRTSLQGGKVLVTRGVEAQGPPFVAQALAAVQGFDAFTPDNDPHGEHDFGSFVLEGHKVFFKIDYYAPGVRFGLADVQYGSEDPTDAAKTLRVLTICLAEEY